MSSLKQLEEPLLPHKEQDPATPPNNGSKGLVIMVAGIVFQTIGFVIGKFIYKLNSSITTFEILTSRSLV